MEMADIFTALSMLLHGIQSAAECGVPFEAEGVIPIRRTTKTSKANLVRSAENAIEETSDLADIIYRCELLAKTLVGVDFQRDLLACLYGCHADLGQMYTPAESSLLGGDPTGAIETCGAALTRVSENHDAELRRLAGLCNAEATLAGSLSADFKKLLDTPTHELHSVLEANGNDGAKVAKGSNAKSQATVTTRQQAPMCEKCNVQMRVKSSPAKVRYVECPQCKATGKQTRS